MAPTFQMLIYLISYVLFFLVLLFSKKLGGNRIFDDNGPVVNKRMLIWLQLAGIILLGVGPVILSDHQFIEIIFGKNPASVLPVFISACMVIITLPVARMAADKKFSVMIINRPRALHFNAAYLTNYFFVRVLFLVAYETWFRGYLLTDCIACWGPVIAMLINIMLYVLLHSVNGKTEMRGCIPLGALLCILCIWPGAALPGIVVHITLAATFEGRIVKRITNPSISFV